MNANELVAIRYDFDGYGYQYMDSGSGSDWQTRVEGESLYSEAFVRQQQAEIEALKIKNQALKIMNDGKNKIIEEYEHKYPDFFYMEHDIQGER